MGCVSNQRVVCSNVRSERLSTSSSLSLLSPSSTSQQSVLNSLLRLLLLLLSPLLCFVPPLAAMVPPASTVDCCFPFSEDGSHGANAVDSAAGAGCRTPSLGRLVMLRGLATFAEAFSDRQCSNEEISTAYTMRVPWGRTSADTYNVTSNRCTIRDDMMIVPWARNPNDPPAAVGVWVVVTHTIFAGVSSKLVFGDNLIFGPGSGVIIHDLTLPPTTPAIRIIIRGSFESAALFSLSGLSFNADKSRPTVVAINGLRLSGGATGVIYNVSLGADTSVYAGGLTTLGVGINVTGFGSSFTIADSTVFANAGNPAIAFSAPTVVREGGALVLQNVTASTEKSYVVGFSSLDIGSTSAALVGSGAPKSTLLISSCRFTKSDASFPSHALAMSSKSSAPIVGALILIEDTSIVTDTQALLISTSGAAAEISVTTRVPSFSYGEATALADVTDAANDNPAGHVVIARCTFAVSVGSTARNAIDAAFGRDIVFFYDGSNRLAGGPVRLSVIYSFPSNFSHIHVRGDGLLGVAWTSIELQWPRVSGGEPSNATFVRIKDACTDAAAKYFSIDLGNVRDARVSVDGYIGAYRSEIKWAACDGCRIKVANFTVPSEDDHQTAMLVIGTDNYAATSFNGRGVAGSGVEVRGLTSLSNNEHSLHIYGVYENAPAGILVSEAHITQGGMAIKTTRHHTPLRIEKSAFVGVSTLYAPILISATLASPEYYTVGAASTVVIADCFVLMRVNMTAINFGVMPGEEGSFIVLNRTEIMPDGDSPISGSGGVIFGRALLPGTFVFISGCTMRSLYDTTEFFTFALPPTGVGGSVLHDHTNAYRGAGRLSLPLYATAAATTPSELVVPRAVSEAMCASVHLTSIAALDADFSEAIPTGDGGSSTEEGEEGSTAPWRLKDRRLGLPPPETPAARMTRIYYDGPLFAHCRAPAETDSVGIPPSHLIFLESVGAEHSITVTVTTHAGGGTANAKAHLLWPVIVVRNSTLASLRIGFGSAIDAVVLLLGIALTGRYGRDAYLSSVSAAPPLLRVRWGASPAGNNTLIVAHRVATAEGRGYGGAEFFGVVDNADLGGDGASWGCASSAGGGVPQPSPAASSTFSDAPLIALLRCSFGGRVGLMASSSHLLGDPVTCLGSGVDLFAPTRMMALDNPTLIVRHCDFIGGLGIGGTAHRPMVLLVDNRLFCAPSADRPPAPASGMMPPGATGPHGTAYSPCLHFGLRATNTSGSSGGDAANATDTSDPAVFFAGAAVVIANSTVLVAHLALAGPGDGATVCGPSPPTGPLRSAYGRFCGIGFSADVSAGTALIVYANAVTATAPIANRTTAFRLFRLGSAEDSPPVGGESGPLDGSGIANYGSGGGLIAEGALAVISNNAFLCPRLHTLRQTMARAAFIGAARHCVGGRIIDAHCREGPHQFVCDDIGGDSAAVAATAADVPSVVSIRSGGGTLHFSGSNRCGARHAGDVVGPYYGEGDVEHFNAIIAASPALLGGVPNGGIVVALAAIPLPSAVPPNVDCSTAGNNNSGNPINSTASNGGYADEDEATLVRHCFLQFAKNRHIVSIRGAFVTEINISDASSSSSIGGVRGDSTSTSPLAACVVIDNSTVYGRAVISFADSTAADTRIAVVGGSRIGFGLVVPPAESATLTPYLFFCNAVSGVSSVSLSIVSVHCHRCVVSVGDTNEGDQKRQGKQPCVVVANVFRIAGFSDLPSVIGTLDACTVLITSILSITITVANLRLSGNSSVVISGCVTSGTLSLSTVALKASTVLISETTVRVGLLNIRTITLDGVCESRVLRARSGGVGVPEDASAAPALVSCSGEGVGIDNQCILVSGLRASTFVISHNTIMGSVQLGPFITNNGSQLLILGNAVGAGNPLSNGIQLQMTLRDSFVSITRNTAAGIRLATPAILTRSALLVEKNTLRTYASAALRGVSPFVALSEGAELINSTVWLRGNHFGFIGDPATTALIYAVHIDFPKSSAGASRLIFDDTNRISSEHGGIRIAIPGVGAGGGGAHWRNPFAPAGGPYGRGAMAAPPQSEREAAAHIASGFSYFCAAESERSEAYAAMLASWCGEDSYERSGKRRKIAPPSAVPIGGGDFIAIVGAVLRSLDVNVGSAVGSSVTVLDSTVSDRLVISGELRGNANVTIAGCKVSGPAALNISSPNCSSNVCFLTIARNAFSDALANASEPLLRINSAAISADGVHAAIVGNILTVGHGSGVGLLFTSSGDGIPIGGTPSSSSDAGAGRGKGANVLIAFNSVVAHPTSGRLSLLDLGIVGPMHEYVVWGNAVTGGAGIAALFTADAARLVIVGNTAPSFLGVKAWPYAPSSTQQQGERHLGCNALSSGGYAHFSPEDFGAEGLHECTENAAAAVRLSLRCGWDEGVGDSVLSPPLLAGGAFTSAQFPFCPLIAERGVAAVPPLNLDAILGADAPPAPVPAAFWRDQHDNASEPAKCACGPPRRAAAALFGTAYGHYRQLLWETGGRGPATARHEPGTSKPNGAGSASAWVTAVVAGAEAAAEVAGGCAALPAGYMRALPAPEPEPEEYEGDVAEDECLQTPSQSLPGSESLSAGHTVSRWSATEIATQSASANSSRSKEPQQSSIVWDRRLVSATPSATRRVDTPVTTGEPPDASNGTAPPRTNFTVKPIPNPFPPAVDTARRVTGAVGFAVSVASVASVTGGQVGVANAMARMISCGGSDGGASGGGAGGDDEEEVPILVHPLRFSVWGGQGDEDGMYFAASVSNMLLIPSAVALVSRFVMPRALVCVGLQETEASALTTVGWPSVVAMPIITLGHRRIDCEEPLGVGKGHCRWRVLWADGAGGLGRLHRGVGPRACDGCAASVPRLCPQR